MPVCGKKVGLLLPIKEGIMDGHTPRGEDVLAMARRAEDIGLDSVWLVDHFLHEPYVDEQAFGHQMPEDMKGHKVGFWECWTMAAAIAVATERVEIGTLVTNTGYRNPTLLARMIDTVDELSDGRLICGVGAGDFPSEYQMYGYDWGRRVGKFEEALQILTPMLRGESVSFDGEFYFANDAELRPRGPRSDGPPLLIGLLEGGPRMRRLVAQYADHWNCWLVGGRDYDSCYEVVVQACRKHGRDPATLVKNAAIGMWMPGRECTDPAINPMTGSAEELAEQLRSFLSKDIDHVVIRLDPMTLDGLHQLDDVLGLLD
ncbi:MAG: hypothetical protein CMO26_04510 [Thiotrichales bacterium]|nr:hypothetical protein [Thiotrichales bacterium]|tara:strand:- start:935 stop:1882 length:948 start_codon:yes stop_codon:yes gene_type:complete